MRNLPHNGATACELLHLFFAQKFCSARLLKKERPLGAGYLTAVCAEQAQRAGGGTPECCAQKRRAFILAVLTGWAQLSQVATRHYLSI